MFVLKPDLNKFSSFCKLPACWSHYFCRKKSLDSFSPSERLTKWAKFGFSIFWVFYQAGCLQNEQSLPFQVFEVSKLWKPPASVKRGVWVRGVFLSTSFTINWLLLFVVNQLFSQKWSPKLSKENFCSKTLGTVFAVFVLHSTSFPINLIIIVCCQSIIFSEM